MPCGNWVEGQCLTPGMDSVGKCPTIVWGGGGGEGMHTAGIDCCIIGFII